MTLQRSSPLVLFLLVALVVAVLVTAMPRAPITVLTKHAAEKQVGLGLDVAAITAFIELGKCNPVTVYTCPIVVKYVCPLKAGMTGQDDLHMGIIVGNQTYDGSPIVITGWVAPRHTWERQGIRDGCTSGAVFIPVPAMP